MDKSILTECFADTLLFETLVPTRVGYNHKHGCYNVEAEMQLGELKDEFAVGIVDKDKKRIKYLNDFVVIDRVKDDLILWKHKTKAHFIIQICPALEKWILNICEAERIDLDSFELPSELKELMEYTKSRKSVEDLKLKKLFKAINKRIEHEGVRKLKSWVTHLKDKNYKADINVLQNG
jgi:hypothetical protein